MKFMCSSDECMAPCYLECEALQERDAQLMRCPFAYPHCQFAALTEVRYGTSPNKPSPATVETAPQQA